MKNKNNVIKQNCHSRGMLSGRTANLMGFTLIELLVVVLIIGILAAVAVPQYQKSVEKSRIATALAVIDSIKKNMDMYLLENGAPVPYKNSTDGVQNEYFFLWVDEVAQSATKKVEGTIDARAGLDCSDEKSGLCTDGNFWYDAFCSSAGCYADAYRSMGAYNSEDKYFIGTRRPVSTNQWEYYCYYFDDFGQRACSTLQGQGNWQIEDGNE